MRIEIGTLLGVPHLFLQGFEVSKEILDEYAELGESIMEDSTSLAALEVAIPIDSAVDRRLAIEDGKAWFQD